jgi:leader peptidase (prepilin peptidase)/N-methyltransferase
VIEFLEAIPWILDLLAVLCGLIIGSFLNVCIYRLPLEMSIVRPRSSCPSCNRAIAWFDNIPLLSYVVLQGKCRHCSAGIPIRYPLIEAITGLVSWLVFYRFGLGLDYFVYFSYAAALLVVSVIDLDHRIIPDQISLSGIVIGLLLAAFTPVIPFLDSLIGLAIGGGSLLLVGMAYEALRKQEGIGGGDIKLLAMIGAFTGWKGVLFTIFGGSLIASIVGISLMIVRRSNGQVPIPFGPFLSGASFLYILVGDRLINAYWAMLPA